jgi:chaperonin cofactor prefoldin
MTVIVKLNEELETLSKSIAILHEKDKDLTEKITQMKLALN